MCFQAYKEDWQCCRTPKPISLPVADLGQRQKGQKSIELFLPHLDQCSLCPPHRLSKLFCGQVRPLRHLAVGKIFLSLHRDTNSILKTAKEASEGGMTACWRGWGRLNCTYKPDVVCTRYLTDTYLCCPVELAKALKGKETPVWLHFNSDC